jgi:deoxyribonuclease V
VPSFAAVDVHYPDTGGATAALVVAQEPTFAELVVELAVHQDEVAPYRAGAFYERELPALLAAVRAAPQPPDLLVVDGYVTLDPHGRQGLGAHVHRELGIPVIGVAKSALTRVDQLSRHGEK